MPLDFYGYHTGHYHNPADVPKLGAYSDLPPGISRNALNATFPYAHPVPYNTPRLSVVLGGGKTSKRKGGGVTLRGGEAGVNAGDAIARKAVSDYAQAKSQAFAYDVQERMCQIVHATLLYACMCGRVDALRAGFQAPRFLDMWHKFAQPHLQCVQI